VLSLYFEKEHEGPSVGKPVAVQIRGEKFGVLEEISEKVSGFLNNIDGVSDVASDYEVGRGKPASNASDNGHKLEF